MPAHPTPAIPPRLPLRVRVRLAHRDLKRGFKGLVRRVTNSARAFRATEVGYRLAIDRYGGYEVAYRRGTVDEKVLEQTLLGDFIEREIPEFRPEPADVVLDVGAHIGAFALLAAARVPEGRVHAIEASRESFNYLRVNAALNRFENLHPSHLALSDRPGVVFLSHDMGSWGHSITRRLSGEGEEVPAETLEGFLDARGISVCHFAKFNCEGAELPILLGASRNTLRRMRQMLVMYHCDLAPGYDSDELLVHLQSAGFETAVRHRTSMRGWILARRVS